MKVIKAIVAALCFVPALGSAQNKIEPIAFVPDPAKPIKRIALLDTAPVPQYTVMDTGGGSAVFGIVGLGYSLSRKKELIESFNAEMKRRDLQLHKAIDEAVAAAMARRGIEVVRIHGIRPKPAGSGQSPDFSEIQTDADAILSISAPLIGYYSRVNVTIEFMPLLSIVARLQSGDGKATRALSFHTYCSNFPKNENVMKVACAPSVNFFTSDKALLDPEGPSVQHLYSGVQPLVEQMIDQFAHSQEQEAKP